MKEELKNIAVSLCQKRNSLCFSSRFLSWQDSVSFNSFEKEVYGQFDCISTARTFNKKPNPWVRLCGKLFYSLSILFFFMLPLQMMGQKTTVKIALLKYNGGGDWYANPTSLPNLIRFCNRNLKMNIDPSPGTVEVGSVEIFNYPFVHMTGHGNVIFSEQEIANLKRYLESGGFLHIDDNYGLNPYIRREMKRVFPDQEFIELPLSHLIYHQHYEFPQGLPKIHEHDNKPPQGFGLFVKGRLVCFFTYECDLGDGWEDPAVHNDPKDLQEQALKMGANILSYVFTN